LDSDYSYSIQGQIILVIDEDKGGTSVTNNISNVLRDIAIKEGIDPVGFNIAYKDSMGNWDGVSLSSNGKASFYPIREPGAEGVLEYFRSRTPNCK
jgi:hypothetical protein